MESKSFENKIVDLLRKQQYGESNQQINEDQLIKSYAHFPNEAIYIVDCQKADVEFLTSNIGQMFGIDERVKNSLITIYENINSQDFSNIVDFGNKAMNSAIIERDKLQSLGDKFSCIYRTPNNRTIIKNTYVLAKDSLGQVSYTLGQLIDVTDLVSFTGFKYQVYGENAANLIALIGDLPEFRSTLTKREIEVLILLSKGFLSKQIADQLFISKGTVDKHRKNIIKKLQVNNSLAAYKKALDMGVLKGL
ncbi:LuxR C-terminal-related transcriptional regulator [Marivirga salinae]|uniref:LuxR C-terminal-related transcriptional regulator n=1 Tax=Marivirga salinarum TaxID=3059078 RepID=A0AA51N9B8_9BACT|nr:LuxR C-terminal-related transcriptional regulator [Marivirga sp. BDSF4-3]WMN11067.1 LuxR C-terminal-related transcriptional regulator [Marivirga sp. BDSF4-3]